MRLEPARPGLIIIFCLSWSHGSSDAEHPSKSAFLLGTETVEKLTIDDLQPLNQGLSQLAYLSACATAELGQNLIDESIHVASTFQLDGFRHFNGTTRGAYDSIAVAMSDRFYENLLEQNADTVSNSSVPRALHHAVLDLRAQNGNTDNISLWAPFIHRDLKRLILAIFSCFLDVSIPVILILRSMTSQVSLSLRLLSFYLPDNSL